MTSLPAPEPDSRPALTTPGRRRDRHGRGLRGPLLPPHLPAWRTRAEKFDEMVASAAEDLSRRWPVVKTIQFAVEEVPPSDPAPWERGVVLGRGFSAEPRAGLPSRIIIYRQPVSSRADGEDELAELVRQVVVEQVAQMLGRRPEDIDPTAFRA
ncbi:metallopeptidase family protein [Actinomyces urogenitalis]|uniref:metallopeptidase family protein n=1 Tax=Actinomyces urogenitalis TaxID=103621 RepID=UPI00242B2C76|nr:metallopeptidase family protein [Actinomyces urogenitalis]MCI7457522.1 metallopeptidase family protein [Actinomyces urogenitalis]